MLPTMTGNTTELTWPLTYKNCIEGKAKRLTLFYVILSVILCLNGLVIFVLTRKVRRLSVYNTLILHLSLTDFILSASSTILTISILTSSQVVSSAICQIVHVVVRTTYNCSMYFIAILAACRCYGVLKPFSYRANIYPSKVNKICLTVWCFSFAFALTPIVGWGKYEPVKGQCTCSLDSHTYLGKWMETLTIFYIVPTLINILSLISTAVALANRNKPNPLTARKENVRKAERSGQMSSDPKAISSTGDVNTSRKAFTLKTPSYTNTASDITANKESIARKTFLSQASSNSSADYTANKSEPSIKKDLLNMKVRKSVKDSFIQTVTSSKDSTETSEKKVNRHIIKDDIHHIQVKPENCTTHGKQLQRERETSADMSLSNNDDSSPSHMEEKPKEYNPYESLSQKDTKYINGKKPRRNSAIDPQEVVQNLEKSTKEAREDASQGNDHFPRILFVAEAELTSKGIPCGLNGANVRINVVSPVHLQKKESDEDEQDEVEHQSSDTYDQHQEAAISLNISLSNQVSHSRQVITRQQPASRRPRFKQPKFLFVGIFSLVNIVLYGVGFTVRTKYAFSPQSVSEDTFVISNTASISNLLINPFLCGLLSDEIITYVRNKMLCR